MNVTNNETIMLNTKQKVVPEEVIMLQADINYTWLFLENNNKMLVCTTLKNLEKSFGLQNNFYRISRSTIVNLDFMKSADFYTSEIFMNDKSCIQIARRRRTQFLNHIRNNESLHFSPQKRKREFSFV